VWFSAGIYGWIVFGVIIVGGNKLILVGDRAGMGKILVDTDIL